MERLARIYVKGIFTSFEDVRYIVERHEHTIRKRWSKKSTAKKKKLLLTARPDMASGHRPDIETDLAEPARYKDDQRILTPQVCRARNSAACLVPFLNLEDLLQPGTLLTFLNSRGRATIESFSQTELLNCPIARWPDSCLRQYLPDYTMVFVGKNKRNNYGQMKHWTDQGDARLAIYSGRGVHPGHGLQILRIQEIIYTFLQRCCHLLVGDILADKKGQPERHPITPPIACLGDKSTNYINRAEVSLMAPYGNHRQLDFDRLRSLVSSKVCELEDHVWALREDPGYFTEISNDYKAHRSEYVQSTDGNAAAILKQPPHVMTGAILRELVLGAYLPLFYWQECLRLVTALRTTAIEKNFNFPDDQDLPEGYHVNFLLLWTMLHVLHTDKHETFRHTLLGCPNMRPYFVKAYTDQGSVRYHCEIDAARANGDSTILRFLEVLLRIWEPFSPPTVGFIAELDDLERMATKVPVVKGLVSSLAWSEFSQLSISSECIQQIRSYQPWATKIQNDVEQLRPLLMSWFRRLGLKWEPIAHLRRFEDVALALKADPSDGKFYYPSTEKQTKKTTDAMRLAEKNLDAFWLAADTFCGNLTGTSLPDLLLRHRDAGRAARRTAPWTEALPQRHEERVDENISNPVTTSGEHNKSQALIRGKIKTRGTDVSASLTGTDQRLANETLESPTPKLNVDKRSYLVFKTLFFSPSARDVPGEVSWKDFVHAMVQRGFEAEKLHGSAWRFTPALDTERAIQFHAPHGALSKLPLTWARRYGRRLEREYGWTGEMFTLA